MANGKRRRPEKVGCVQQTVARQGERPATCRLPNSIEPLVEAERLIRRDHWDIVTQSPNDDVVVEGVRVLERQLEEQEGMIGRLRQRADAQIFERLARVGAGDFQFASGYPDRDRPQRNRNELLRCLFTSSRSGRGALALQTNSSPH